MARIYVYIQLGLMVLMYVVPYTLLSESKGPELFLFWAITTIAIGVLSILYLKKNKG
ncbi:MAG: hypothetical protein QXE81_04995 [Desulfurococcaceae archaeon]